MSSPSLIDLNGDWNLHWNDPLRGGALLRRFEAEPDLSRCLPAKVPGSIHLELHVR